MDFLVLSKRIMKVLLYTLLSYSLLFNISIASAQGWEKTYVDSAGMTRAIDVVSTDEGYLLVGEFDLPTGAIRHHIKIIKTDLNGNLQWEKIFNEPWDIVNEKVVFIDQTSDENFIIGGSQWSSPFLMKLNPNGDILWTKRFEEFNDPKIIHAGILLENDNFLLIGTDNNLISSGNYIALPYLIKFDNFGNFLWEKTITETSENQIMYDVKETSDNGFILAGTDYEKSILIKTNNEGEVQWRSEYELTSTNFGGSVVETSDGGFLLGGSTIEITGQVPFLLKVDANGIFDWLKFPTDLTSGRFTHLEKTADNGYIATGSAIDFWSSVEANGFAIKLDENGENEWVQIFNNNIHGSAIHPTLDGGFILAGWNEGMFIKKIGGIVSTQKTFSPEIELSVFPNPMDDFTTFNIETEEFQTFQLRVFNSLGQVVRTEQSETSIFNFYKKNLITGIYFFEISSEEKLLAKGKLKIH